MDIGFQGDVKLIVALAACPVGYGEVGLWFADESKHPSSWVIMHYGWFVEPLRAVDQSTLGRCTKRG